MKVADKRQGIQVADRVTCKCLSWAIYLSAFLAKRGDVCHSCQLCVIFPLCLSSSFIPWMEVLFDFLFLAQLAGGAPLSRCPHVSLECANLASSRNGWMKNRTEDIRKPSSFSRHTEAWRCKFTCYSVGELMQSLPFGALQYPDHHTRSSVKKTGLSFFSFGWFQPALLHHSKYKCLWKQGISKLLLFYSGINNITDETSLQVWHRKTLHLVRFHISPWQKLSNPSIPCCWRSLWVQRALKHPPSHERQRANSSTLLPSTTII